MNLTLKSYEPSVSQQIFRCPDPALSSLTEIFGGSQGSYIVIWWLDSDQRSGIKVVSVYTF